MDGEEEGNRKGRGQESNNDSARKEGDYKEDLGKCNTTRETGKEN